MRFEAEGFREGRKSGLEATVRNKRDIHTSAISVTSKVKEK